MNEERGKQVALILCTVTKLLKEFNFGLTVLKDGSIMLVDGNTGDGYKVSAKDLQDLYDKAEVEE